MKHKRVCQMCGAEYSYCNSCRQHDNEPRWKFLFHEENCLKIYKVVNAYKTNAITIEEAKKQLSSLNLNINIVPGFKVTIDEIMKNGSVEVKPEPERREEKHERPNFQKDRYKNFKKEYNK